MPEGVLLDIGDVNFDVVDHRRGLSDETGKGRCCRHHHNLEASLLIATAMIRHPDNLSDILAGRLLGVLHLPDADQLGLREVVVCGFGSWRKVLVGDLQRRDDPSFMAQSSTAASPRSLLHPEVPHGPGPEDLPQDRDHNTSARYYQDLMYGRLRVFD